MQEKALTQSPAMDTSISLNYPAFLIYLDNRLTILSPIFPDKNTKGLTR